MQGRLAVLTLWLLPASLAAQGAAWPTLTGAGLEYLSPSGVFQLSVSGRLDLETYHVGDSWAGLVEHRDSEPVLDETSVRCSRCHIDMAEQGDGDLVSVHRLRLFADLFLGDHVYSLVEVRSDRGHVPSDGDIEARVEQAFVRFSTSNGSLGVQVGRFANPFGSYASRHLSELDPFLRAPLPYDYRTVMNAVFESPEPAKIPTWKDAPTLMRKPGSPPVWDVPYQWGAMLVGSVGAFDLRAAAVNGAPSSRPDAWGWNVDRLLRPSWVGGFRARASAALRLGASYSRGPWMEDVIRERPPEGWVRRDPRDYDQELLSIDLEYMRGPVVLRAEVMRDRWELPNVDELPEDHSYYVEIQSDIRPGFWAAARIGYMDFRPFDDGSPALQDWDFDVYRYEGSLGYQIVRNGGVVLSAYRQVQSIASDGDTSLVGLRLWWAF